MMEFEFALILFVVFILTLLISFVPQPVSVVEVYQGEESVRLSCWVSGSLQGTTVGWHRHDLNPSTVHLHQDQHKPYDQNQKYRGRTSISPSNGAFYRDFSLTLRKPHLCDSGSYTCTIYNNNHVVQRINVQLQVKEPLSLSPSACFILPGLLAVCLVAVVAFALAAYCWYITVSQVEVEEGAWLVKLPYRTTVSLPPCLTVEWSRCAPEPMKVHQFQNGNNNLVRQDEFYCSRTEMERDPLRTGDLSLTLRDPCDRDSGTYICTVYQDGKVWTQKVVRLQVKVVLKVVEVQEGAQSVTLPFRTRARLPGDATVEWTRFDDTKVHVYQRGCDHSKEQDPSYSGRTNMSEHPLQTGDLSLTLRDPTQADSGIYCCNICRDGDVIWRRRVQLQVKAFTEQIKKKQTTLWT